MFVGNINVIEAALAKGVKKFILVTSIGCGDTKDAPGEQVRQGGLTGGGGGVMLAATH
jgi:nucleoside-diphosphate-sugar epimerase